MAITKARLKVKGIKLLHIKKGGEKMEEGNIKLKMLQVYEESHKLAKELALKSNMSIRKYIEKILKEKQDETV